ncbi:DUF6314 family protein [Octadecabacter ascidiaceicola]|uniref:DUF6314 domain-containing protein n=1 Tax=Octadecabacter ascidiaceicola TaxID=1655543 RepID=A0A238JR82_9RHOB|nr:DUF6314 family protein [Octadecabacter ascidiaceicola]SMX32256.1 hypothetical protein OCA8868_00684 [Octadecabacter ascidiaceicola]
MAQRRELSAFIGRYSVSRRIDDRHAQIETLFDGQAEIAVQGDGAIYREVGHLIVGDQRFEAERRYLWHEDAERIFVSFEDGRAFHDFDPTLGGQASEHLCGEDMYRGAYDFSEWARWSVTWNVQGPRKDYMSTTSYVKR